MKSLDKHIIEEMKLVELKEALNLVEKVFVEFEAPDYSQEGVNAFIEFINYNSIKKVIEDKVLKFWICKEENNIIGVVAIKNSSHICMLFVDKKYHRKGIGTNLFLSAKREVLNQNQTEKITVNSSPYAVDFYHRLGFNDIDSEQITDGIRYTPMELFIKSTTPDEKFRKVIEFIIEIDKLKEIFRQNYLANGSRKENDAEHSWHMAVMAFLLVEHIDIKVDITKVLKMVLIHDLIEIYAGDTYCYDIAKREQVKKKEAISAEKLFGMLPNDVSKEYLIIWEEFEKCETNEAKYAKTLDKIQPFILNYNSKGKVWKEKGISSEKVLGRNADVEVVSKKLWNYIQDGVKDSIDKKYIEE